MMNERAHYAYLHALQPVLTNPANRYLAAALWRDAKANGHEEEFLAVWRERRADWVRWQVLTQRKWQTSVSRRPQRGRHHDSWSIRERYVRC